MNNSHDEKLKNLQNAEAVDKIKNLLKVLKSACLQPG